MRLGQVLGAAVIVSSLAASGIPALAESSDSADDSRSGLSSMRHNGHGMVGGGVMGGGCASMLRSMNNGGQRPNE